jgi:Flp pilus assembly secretin CpaC
VKRGIVAVADALRAPAAAPVATQEREAAVAREQKEPGCMKLIGVLDVEVAIDTGTLQQKIRSVTGSRGIGVRSSNGQIVLSGVAGTR